MEELFAKTSNASSALGSYSKQRYPYLIFDCDGEEVSLAVEVSFEVVVVEVSLGPLDDNLLSLLLKNTLNITTPKTTIINTKLHKVTILLLLILVLYFLLITEKEFAFLLMKYLLSNI